MIFAVILAISVIIPASEEFVIGTALAHGFVEFAKVFTKRPGQKLVYAYDLE